MVDVIRCKFGTIRSRTPTRPKIIRKRCWNSTETSKGKMTPFFRRDQTSVSKFDPLNIFSNDELHIILTRSTFKKFGKSKKYIKIKICSLCKMFRNLSGNFGQIRFFSRIEILEKNDLFLEN